MLIFSCFRSPKQKQDKLYSHTPIFTEPDYSIRDTPNCLARYILFNKNRGIIWY